MSNDLKNFDQWCLVELFGHQRIAGRVSEQTVGGCAFVRVDVPVVENTPAYTKLYGNGAIYAITPVTEEIARAAAKTYQEVPVSPYEIRNLKPYVVRTRYGQTRLTMEINMTKDYDPDSAEALACKSQPVGTYNAEVSGAGTASAGLTGYADGGNGERE